MPNIGPPASYHTQRPEPGKRRPAALTHPRGLCGRGNEGETGVTSTNKVKRG